MALWYSTRPRASTRLGKFAGGQRHGNNRWCGTPYRGYEYHLVRHLTGTTLRRAIYHVTIHNPHRMHVAYLPGHGSVAEATRAARDWIDARLDGK